MRLSIGSLELPTSDPFGVSLKNISLDVHGGEVVAIAGIAGNGQSELFRRVSGEQTVERTDAVVINGHAAGHLGITGRRNLGAAFVPEERLGHGAVPGLGSATMSSSPGTAPATNWSSPASCDRRKR